MPRNASGVYSLPPAAGNPVVSATAIEPGWANQTLGDIATELTGSLPRNGSAPMTAALLLAGNAAVDLAAVPKQQLDAAIAAVSVAASAVNYAGGTGMSATDVEGALDELATGKSNTGHTHTTSSITDAGTAATKNTGTTVGTVPLVGTVSASEILAGLSRRATNAEAILGTEDTAHMTALKTAQLVTALYSNRGTAQNLTSTGVSFTGIPATAKRIIIAFAGASLSGADGILVQLGVSGVAETTVYASTSVSINNTSASSGGSSTSGFLITTGASSLFSGMMELLNVSGNIWVESHSGKQITTNIVTGGGDKTLAGVLDSIFITRTGTDTFDAGSVNIFVLG